MFLRQSIWSTNKILKEIWLCDLIKFWKLFWKLMINQKIMNADFVAKPHPTKLYTIQVCTVYILSLFWVINDKKKNVCNTCSIMIYSDQKFADQKTYCSYLVPIHRCSHFNFRYENWVNSDLFPVFKLIYPNIAFLCYSGPIKKHTLVFDHTYIHCRACRQLSK